jgi:hypothetical protein
VEAESNEEEFDWPHYGRTSEKKEQTVLGNDTMKLNFQFAFAG